MRMRGLFHRKGTSRVPVSPPSNARRGVPVPPEQVQDLQEAWAELTEAAQHSKVISFQACTRSGRPWTEDAAAVRDIAATLRGYPLEDQHNP